MNGENNSKGRDDFWSFYQEEVEWCRYLKQSLCYRGFVSDNK